MFIDHDHLFTRGYNPAYVQHNRQHYAEYISFWQKMGDTHHADQLIRADRGDRAYDC
jgi:hypothetical protein